MAGRQPGTGLNPFTATSAAVPAFAMLALFEYVLNVVGPAAARPGPATIVVSGELKPKAADALTMNSEANSPAITSTYAFLTLIIQHPH
jgi:hypothetical protein